MRVLDRLTVWMGLGLFFGIKFEWLNGHFNNMTLGIHGQEWEADCNGKLCKLNELYVGLLFFRFIFEFTLPDD